MMNKTPVFLTFPWAFVTPGGGEMQILKYKEYLKKKGIFAEMFNLWLPQIKPNKKRHNNPDPDPLQAARTNWIVDAN